MLTNAVYFKPALRYPCVDEATENAKFPLLARGHFASLVQSLKGQAWAGLLDRLQQKGEALCRQVPLLRGVPATSSADGIGQA